MSRATISRLLQHAQYSSDLCARYMDFFYSYVIPYLGPSPKEITQSSPKSYMGDDGSPIEFSWVITKDRQDMIRFTMEPLSWTDGSPMQSTSWMSALDSLTRQGPIDHGDLTWPQICFDTLVASENGAPISSQHASQFSIGTKCRLQQNFHINKDNRC